jgi:hypothetical protein
MGENGNTEQWDVDWVFAPGEDFYMAVCPPYCSSRSVKASAWMTAKGGITLTEYALAEGQDETFIQRWVYQLVRQRLGAALEAAETEASRGAPEPVRLTSAHIEVKPPALSLIREALRRQAPGCDCGS